MPVQRVRLPLAVSFDRFYAEDRRLSLDRLIIDVSIVSSGDSSRDIAELDGVGKLTEFSPDVRTIFLDLAAGLVMFLLVTVFLHAGRKRAVPETQPLEP